MGTKVQSLADESRQAKLADALADVRRRSECLQRRSFQRLALVVSLPVAERPAPTLKADRSSKEDRLILLKQAAIRAQAKLDEIRAEMEKAQK